MNIFSIFKKRKTNPEELAIVDVLRLTQKYIPDFYKDSKHFKDSEEFINQNELGLALDSLIEMANESGHYFSEDFWNSLVVCADKMQMFQQLDYCKQQIVRNQNELHSNPLKGWTTIKLDDTHFQHHIAEASKKDYGNTNEQTQGSSILITTKKLEIFQKYGGSSGGYDYVSKKHLRILPSSEFAFIDRLVQDIKLIEKGLAASSYEEEVIKIINESCDNPDTICHLKTIATNS